jgi:prolyl-tRNA synthetase
MVHGDQKGLVLPPKIAPIQVVIVPIMIKNSDTYALMQAVRNLAQDLRIVGIRVHIDDREESPGAKFYHWELRGVPLRVEIGPRDLAQSSCVVSDRLGISKQTVPLNHAIEHLVERIHAYHKHLYDRAHKNFKAMWHTAETLAEIVANLEVKPGFYQTGWCQDKACEAVLKEHKATTRCLINEHTFKKCFNCGNPSIQDVLVARSY